MNRIKDYYQVHQYRLDYIYDQIIKLNLPSHATILDVGCYPPYLFDKLSKIFTVYGISSPHEPVKHPRVKTLDIETDDLIFNTQFDLIIFTEIIEHLTNPYEILSKLQPLLNKNGFILITTPNAVRWHNLILMAFGKNIYFPLFQLEQSINYRHQREYTLQELKYFAANLKLDIRNLSFFIAYPPFREKNKKDTIALKIVKYVIYILEILFPNRRDSLLGIFQK